MSSETLVKEDTLRRGVAEEPTRTTAGKPWGSARAEIFPLHRVRIKKIMI